MKSIELNRYPKPNENKAVIQLEITQEALAKIPQPNWQDLMERIEKAENDDAPISKKLRLQAELCELVENMEHLEQFIRRSEDG